MEPAGERWWPVFGAVYFLVAVKRVRGMRLVGLARDQRQRVKAKAATAVATPPAAASDDARGTGMTERRGQAPSRGHLHRWRLQGQPGPAAAGAPGCALGEHEKELFGGEPLTTNNRMELTAVIEALAALKRACDVTLYTDSEYVRKGITEWIHGWKQRGWKTADSKPVKNADLWQRLDALAPAAPGASGAGCKGHAGDPGNERADALANRGVDCARSA